MPQRLERRLEYDKLRSGKRKEWFKEWRPKGCNRRITSYMVRNIRWLWMEGETIAELARRFNISYSYVNDIVHGRKR